MPLTQVSPGMLDSTAQYYSFKNRIINGAMVIDQRNAGAAVTATGFNNLYTLDRWNAIYATGGFFRVGRNDGGVTPPAGFTNYLGVTSLGANTGIINTITQAIEGFNVADLNWGAASAAPVTLSFWVRSSLTGTFGGALSNSGRTRSYPFSYTISSANTWEQKSVTITGDTTGTWLTTNGTGINVDFGLGNNATYSGTAGAWASSDFRSATGAVSVVGTNGATFYITGVQLEKGSTATSFDYRPYGTELALCQRYAYAKRGSEGTGGAAMLGAAGNARSTTAAFVQLTFPTTMRTLPTLTVTNPTSFLLFQTSSIQATAVSLDVADPTAASLQVTVASGLTSPTFYSFGCNNGNALLVFSSEL